MPPDPQTGPTTAGRYDVAIVGAGACGCEAALRLARAGASVVLVTTSLDTVFAAPTERVATDAPEDTLKHEIVRRDEATSGGTIGAWELHGAAKYQIEAEPRIHLLQSSVDRIVVHDGRAVAVETWEGVPRAARAIALCVGPFLRARLRIGEAEERSGRPGEMAYDELADDLRRLGVATESARDSGGGGSTPAWAVHFERLADRAVDEYRVGAVRGLYAAGVCRLGPLAYADAADEGRALAARIAADLERADDDVSAPAPADPEHGPNRR